MKDLAQLLRPYSLFRMFSEDPHGVYARALREKDAHFYERLIRMYGLYKQVQGKTDGEGREAIVRHMSHIAGAKIPKSQVYELFTQGIRAGKHFFTSSVEQYVPPVMKFPFTSDGVAMPTDDPLSLLRIQWQPTGNEAYHDLRSYVAQLFWHLGTRYFMMRLMSQPIEEQLQDLTLFLEEELFCAPEGMERDYDIESHYNPKNFFRYSTKKRHPTIVHRVSVRYIDVDGRYVPILYKSRIKDEANIFRKSILKSAAENPQANDQCGMTVVFLTAEDRDSVYPKFVERVFPDPNALTNVRLLGQGGKKKNEYASDDSPPEKQFLAYVRGGLVEAQFFLYENHFNREFSLGKENHRFYGLSKMWEFFKQNLPPELFLIEWDEKTYEMFQQYQASQIRSTFE